MTQTPQQKLWLAGGGLVALLLVLIGYVFFIGPQRSERDDVQGRTADAQTQVSSLTAKLSALQAQSANLDSYRAAEAKARLALPATSGMSDFLRNLQAIGATTQTAVSALTVSAPTAVTQAAPASSTSSSSSSSSSSSTSSTSSAAPAAGSAASVYSMTITAQVTGATGNLSRFLDQLQSVQPRAVLITSITENAVSAGAVPSLQLTMLAFVAPTSH